MTRSDVKSKFFQCKARACALVPQVALLGCALLGSGLAQAAEDVAIVGKNDWLFVRHEMVLESLDKQAQASFRLIEKLNRMLAQRGVALAVTLVPSKIETYAEHLPDGFKVSPYMKGFNDAALKAMRDNGVAVIDMKPSMRDAALKDLDNPLFFRLDTHWTPSGALVAAQTVQAGIEKNPALKKVLDTVPVVEYKLTWSKKTFRQTNIRDITNFLPAGTPAYPPEENRRFAVTRVKQAGTSLLGASQTGDIALIGSSFSGDWTSFPDSMRFALQRPVLNFSINADAGPWAVVRGFLMDDAFQLGKPKLIIWELPERTIGLGPNYQFRLPRYKMTSTDWLLQVAALAESDCKAMPVRATLGSAGRGGALHTQDKVATVAGDFVELEFDHPVDVSGYLSAQLTADGTKQIDAELYNKTTLVRKFKLEVAGDDRAHGLKTPMSIGAGSATRLRLYPGVTNAFSLKSMEVCRYQDNWLKDVVEF